MSLNRKVVYTCITGNYDTLREVKIISKDVDYICFTDADNLKSITWEIRKIPDELQHYSSVKQQRLIKILAHKYLSEYDCSLYVDSNIEILSDVAPVFGRYDLDKEFLYTNPHPVRNCIYKEHIAVLRLKKDTPETTNAQINRYRDEGFPENFGLVESNIILRKHNDPECIRLMETWADEIKTGSHRDQLSFNYAVWKTGLHYGTLKEKYFRVSIADSAIFKIGRHTPNLLIAGITPEKIEEFNKKIEEAEKKAKEDEKQEAIQRINSGSSNPFNVEQDPLVSVVFFTHGRTKVAANCLNFLLKNLKYPKLRWIISSDRSTDEHLQKLLEEFPKYGISPSDVSVLKTFGKEVGLPASMNNGLKEAFRSSNIVLRIEDDFLLWKPLVLKKYVNAFADENVCNIRIGTLCGGPFSFFPYNGYLNKVQGTRSDAWIFNNQVALVHKRIYDKIGLYKTDCTADKSETEFKDRYNKLTQNGNSKFFITVAPKEMKPHVLDDPSLWFIHVGRSELGHSYKEPARYGFLYDKPFKTNNEKTTKADPKKLFKSTKAKTEDKKSQEEPLKKKESETKPFQVTEKFKLSKNTEKKSKLFSEIERLKKEIQFEKERFQAAEKKLVNEENSNKIEIEALKAKIQKLETVSEKTEVETKVNGKICVFTCITGNYDSIKPIYYRNENIDYICFCDKPIRDSFGWIIRPIPTELKSLPNVRIQRAIKILPHLFLSEYDISIWIDGVYSIVGNVDRLIRKTIQNSPDSVIFLRKHPTRDCIYDEAEACIKENKVDPDIANKQISKYREENYPAHNGLTETNIILRKHNDPECIKLMEMWYKELSENSHRDQLSLDYCIWKLNFEKKAQFVFVQNNLTNGFIEKRTVHNQKVSIYITNFNTTELTNALIKSIEINLRSLNYKIFVLDNSNAVPFKLDDSIECEVNVLDNTKMQIVNTDEYVEKYSKVKSKNNYASFRHAIAIQWIIDNCETDNMILLDSDVILKRDIDFVNKKYMTIADTENNGHLNRFCPFIQYFNIKAMRLNNIRYLDINRMHGGSNPINSKKYDTGASFYEDVVSRGIPYRKINHTVYVNHLRGGSWTGKSPEEFLNDNRIYFEK